MMTRSTLRTIFLAAFGAMLLASCNENAQSLLSSSDAGTVHVAPRIAGASIPTATGSVKAVLTLANGGTQYHDSIVYNSAGGNSLTLEGIPVNSPYRLVLVGKTSASTVLWGADTTVASADSSVVLMSLFTATGLSKPSLSGTSAVSIAVSKDSTLKLNTANLSANQVVYYSVGSSSPKLYDNTSGIAVSAGNTVKAWIVAKLVSGVDSLVSADTTSIAVKSSSSPVKPTYKVTVTQPMNGTITLSPTGGVYDSGSKVIATATATSGYAFSVWTGASTSTISTCTLTVTKDLALSATIVKSTKPTYKVTVTQPTNGTITLSPTGGVYDSGSKVIATATATSGYAFSAWTGASTSTISICTLTVTKDLALSATFTKSVVKDTTYKLKKDTGTGGGTLSFTPDSASYHSGTSVTVTAKADNGYAISAWGGICSGTAITSTTCKVTVPKKDTTASVTFTKSVVKDTTYKLKKDSGVGGGTLSFTPDSASYHSGTSVTVTAKVDNGYAISAWGGICSGTAITSTTCKVTVPKKDTTASVTFKKSAVTDTSTALTALTVNGTLTPSFDSTILVYHDTVDSNTTSEMIRATASSGAASITGVGSVDLSSLNAGDSLTQNVVVTNGTSGTRTYSVVIVKRKGNGGTGSGTALTWGTGVTGSGTTTYTIDATATSRPGYSIYHTPGAIFVIQTSWQADNSATGTVVVNGGTPVTFGVNERKEITLPDGPCTIVVTYSGNSYTAEAALN